jgi:hypothetical protein
MKKHLKALLILIAIIVGLTTMIVAFVAILTETFTPISVTCTIICILGALCMIYRAIYYSL